MRIAQRGVELLFGDVPVAELRPPQHPVARRGGLALFALVAVALRGWNQFAWHEVSKWGAGCPAPRDWLSRSGDQTADRASGH